MGRLGLDGCLKPSRGALAAVLAATRDNNTLCLALEGSPKIANVEDSRLIAVPDLLSLCAALKAAGPQFVAPRFTCPEDACDYPNCHRFEDHRFFTARSNWQLQGVTIC